MFRMAATPKKRDRNDQTSHKVIEKRRRDRINNCLAELSQTVPVAFAKQSSGKLEKAEILEMTVDYLRAIQSTEVGRRFEHGEWYSPDIWADFTHYYQTGYADCMRECVRYLADVEGMNATETRCVRMLSYIQSRFRHEPVISGGVASAFRENGSRHLPVSASPAHGHTRAYQAASPAHLHAVPMTYSGAAGQVDNAPPTHGSGRPSPGSLTPVGDAGTPAHRSHPHPAVRGIRRVVAPYTLPSQGHHHLHPPLHHNPASHQINSLVDEACQGAEINKLSRPHGKPLNSSSPVNPGLLGVLVKPTFPAAQNHIKFTGLRYSYPGAGGPTAHCGGKHSNST